MPNTKYNNTDSISRFGDGIQQKGETGSLTKNMEGRSARGDEQVVTGGGLIFIKKGFDFCICCMISYEFSKICE